MTSRTRVAQLGGALVERYRRRIEARFGGVRSCCRCYGFRLLHRAGALRQFERVDWDRISRIVFVCKGNICRSQYAEAVAQRRGLDAVSFGLEAENGAAVNGRTEQVARARGVNLRGAKAKMFAVSAIGASDLVVAMEPAQGRRLRTLVTRSGGQVAITLLGLWSTPPQPYIPDPYGLSEAFHVTCYDMIDDAVDALARRVVTRTGRRQP